MTINVAPRNSRNRLRHHCHPIVGVIVEIRPTLLEEHHCALRLVHDDPELRWMFGIPDLFLSTCINF